MPVFLENALRHHYASKGFTGKHLDQVVYGTLNNLGAMRGSKTTAKGLRMEAKHVKDMAATKRQKRAKSSY